MNPRMNAQEWSRIWGLIVETWPTLRRLTDRGGWYQDMKGYDPSDVQAAVQQLRRTYKAKEPALAHLIELSEAVQGDRRRQTHTDTQHHCGGCDNGFQWVSDEGRGTVRLCPNGCRPGRIAA
jgi:hypothetical protein